MPHSKGFLHIILLTLQRSYEVDTIQINFIDAKTEAQMGYVTCPMFMVIHLCLQVSCKK